MVTSDTNGQSQVVIGGTELRILRTNGSIGSNEFAEVIVVGTPCAKGLPRD